MLDSNWSVPSEVCDYGTSPDANEVDTVENVLVKDPDEGTWQIDVIAAQINADGRLETPGWNDVDFALVVSVDFDCNGNDQLDPKQA